MMNPNQPPKTPGNPGILADFEPVWPSKRAKPCPYCGCPDEFDHTKECPVLPEVVDLQRRVKQLEDHQAILADSLERTIKQCMELGKILHDFSLMAQGKPPIFNKQ
jgi:hypothetical protein